MLPGVVLVVMAQEVLAMIFDTVTRGWRLGGRLQGGGDAVGGNFIYCDVTLMCFGLGAELNVVFVRRMF